MPRRTPVVLVSAAALLVGSAGASLATDAATDDGGQSARTTRLEAAVLSAEGGSEVISESAFRFSGEDRYATSAEISFLQWEPDEVTEVFLASGENFPDALSMAASTRDTGPLLLTRRDELPPAVADELERLSPCLVIVVGGPSQVSDAVARAADSYTDAAACG